MTAMAHLTCVGHTAGRAREILATTRDAGIENILALARRPARRRLDAPAASASPTQSSWSSSSRDVGDFSVGVAAHPEPHPARRQRDRPPPHGGEARPKPTSRSPSSSSTPTLLRSGRRPAALGVDKPVIPGSCRSASPGQADGGAAGLRVPGWLAERLERSPTTPTRCAGRHRGGDELCRALLDGGAPGPALLHAEPLDRDPRDLRQPRPRPLGLSRAPSGRASSPAGPSDRPDRAPVWL